MTRESGDGWDEAPSALARDDRLGDLHGVERCALAQVVPDDEERQALAVRDGLVGADAPDVDVVLAGRLERVGQALEHTDVVVADRLGPVDLLPRLAEHARIIDVGKRAGYHKVTQDRINATLVEEARKGLRVVRLKGGDPFVFGRGGEEEEFCAAHGVPVEVVPGITSAISVPAAAALGAVGAIAGGAKVGRGIVRVLVWGSAAMAITSGIGHIFGIAA